MSSDLLLASAVAAPFIGAAIAIARAGRKDRLARLDLLCDCAGLLEDGAIAADPSGYGVLKGRYCGRDVALRPFVDSLVFRRLPQLWLAVTVRAETPTPGVVEVIRRPSGSDYYAAGESLPARFGRPPSWPADAQVRGSRDAAALLARLAGALTPALDDLKIKSVYVSQAGARVILQIAQGERGAYLLFRDNRFADARVRREDAETALSLAFAAIAARDAAAEPSLPHEAAA